MPGSGRSRLDAIGTCFVGCDHGLLSIAPNLAYLSALFGVLQNNAAPMIIDNSPFFDLLQRSIAAEASQVVV
jgi:hypothetical protein